MMIFPVAVDAATVAIARVDAHRHEFPRFDDRASRRPVDDRSTRDAL